MYIRFMGSPQDYDKIDAATIQWEVTTTGISPTKTEANFQAALA